MKKTTKTGNKTWRSGSYTLILIKKRQGPAVYLYLSGQAKQCARGLTKEELGTNEGVDKIIAKLDILFEKDKNTQTFLAFNEFYEYRRSSGVNIIEFLVHYEFLYNKLKKLDVVLPEGVQAFFLLKAANVADENERLARTTCGEMTYENMKLCIKKIFGGPTSGGSDGGGAPLVKSEPVFQSSHLEDVNYTSGNRVCRGRGRSRGYNTGAGSRQERASSGMNPVDKDGKMMKCFSCGSFYHFSRYCPSKRYGDNDVKQTKEVHITLLSARSDVKARGLVKECLGKALLDSACTKTVCGATWLNMYLDTLHGDDKALVEVLYSVVAIIKKFAIAIFKSHDLHAINVFGDYCGYAMRAWDARLVRKFVNIDDSSIYHLLYHYH